MLKRLTLQTQDLYKLNLYSINTSRIARKYSNVESPPIATKVNNGISSLSKKPLPFEFETGVALFAKKAARPFPPPFLSPPSASFSDPLSTHDRSRDRRAFPNGELIRGFTNGDDAVYFDNHFIAANDGVGAWSSRPGGHAGLWSRLILHFWALQIENNSNLRDLDGQNLKPNPIQYLQNAYEQTIKATSEPYKWQGTTTVAGAQLYFQYSSRISGVKITPLLYVTSLGDSQVLVLRPRESKLIFKTTQQWHWFDCPRQLGTNSPDTPRDNAIVDVVEIEEGDVVLAVSDGVIDNLWEHEIIETVIKSIRKWENLKGYPETRVTGIMKNVADELMKAARSIATDPFAESPFMEQAIEEGLAIKGGKLDDISVVAAICKRTLS